MCISLCARCLALGRHLTPDLPWSAPDVTFPRRGVKTSRRRARTGTLHEHAGAAVAARLADSGGLEVVGQAVGDAVTGAQDPSSTLSCSPMSTSWAASISA